MILKSSLLDSYTVTTSYANITGLSIKIPGDGYYLVNYNIGRTLRDTDGATAYIYVKLAIDGIHILSSGGDSYHSAGSNGKLNSQSGSYINILYLKKDQVITVQAISGAGQNSYIAGTGTNSATYIEAIKVRGNL